jgi:SEC-C motif-containing protein
MTTSTCPCGSQKKVNECCLPVIKGTQVAQTAETLMRARYSAFALGEIDFIISSHHSRTRDEVKREEVEEWSRKSEWLGLRIVNTQAGQQSDTKGNVIFHARYHMDGKLTDHWENAEFEKENGQWRFLDAKPVKTQPIINSEQKTGRNDPCKCGSGKKSKKCCGA